jgi:ATP-dependent DNA ligase
VRSPAWLKLKPKLTLDVLVTGGSADRIPMGRLG